MRLPCLYSQLSEAVHTPGEGGIPEHVAHQGLDPDSILAKIKTLAK